MLWVISGNFFFFIKLFCYYRYFLRIHSNLFKGTEAGFLDNDDLLEFKHEIKSEKCLDDHVKTSIPEVILSNYANQVIVSFLYLNAELYKLIRIHFFCFTDDARPRRFEFHCNDFIVN